MALLAAPQAPSILGQLQTHTTPTASDTCSPGSNIYYSIRTVGTGLNLTIVVPGTQYGQPRPDIVVAIGTNEQRLFGPLVNDLADPATGLITILHSATTAVTSALLQMGS
jgi:hypothetical protein